MLKYLLILLGLTTGCTTVPGYFYMNTNRFDSPEAIGKLGGIELQGSYNDSTKVVVDADITAPEPGSSGAYIGDDADEHTPYAESLNFVDNLYHNFRLGLGEKFDVGFDFSLGDMPRYLKVKYQFLGNSQKDASKGNFSGALVLGGGYGNREIDDETYADGDSINEAEIEYTTVGLSVLLGKRFSENVLFYYNLSGSLYYSEINADRNIIGVGNSKYRYLSDGHQVLNLIGARIFFGSENAIFVSIEGGTAFTDWDNADSEEELKIGASFGGVF